MRRGWCTAEAVPAGSSCSTAETGRPVCARAGEAAPAGFEHEAVHHLDRAGAARPRYRIATSVRHRRHDRAQRRPPRQPLPASAAATRPSGTPPSTTATSAGSGPTCFLLKGQIWQAGIRAITGRLYADDSVFDRLRGVADSGYATSPYIGPLSGLSFDSGYGGSTQAASPPTRPSSPPQRWRGALRAAGIAIPPRSRCGGAAGRRRTIAKVESPPLTEIVNTTDVYSDNFFAEMLIKLLGARFGGAGTTAAGTTVVERFARATAPACTRSTAPA